MNDAENLTTLLGHIQPAVFRDFAVDKFGLAMPDLDARQGKREQRAGMEAFLAGLPVGMRQKEETSRKECATGHIPSGYLGSQK